MSELTPEEIASLAENDRIIHPRYVDPPVVHLEQVLFCIKHYPAQIEAVVIKDGNSLCTECFYNS